MRSSDSFKVTRRDLMIVGAAAIAARAAPRLALDDPAASTTTWPENFFPTVAFSVNGEPRSLRVTRGRPCSTRSASTFT